ncbi:MAG: hypothetical protein VZQ61_00540 [Christensenellaceae bacterium]
MKNKTYIKCSNCSSTDFIPTSIGTILATEGSFNVNAYACQKCGHIELFEPELDLYAKQKGGENADGNCGGSQIDCNQGITIIKD